MYQRCELITYINVSICLSYVCEERGERMHYLQRLSARMRKWARHTHTDRQTHTYTHRQTDTHTHTPTIHTHTQIDTRTHTDTRTQTQTDTHTHTTHIQTDRHTIQTRSRLFSQNGYVHSHQL